MDTAKLIHLARDGSAEKLQACALQANAVNLSLDSDGTTLLMHACEGNNLPVVNWLVKDMGADPNVKDSDGATPLHRAVGNNNLAMVKLLVDDGKASCTTCDKFGLSPLAWAREHNYGEIAQYLASTG